MTSQATAHRIARWKLARARSGAADDTSFPWIWFMCVLALAVLARVLIAATSHPLVYPDSGSYIALAHQLGALNLAGDVGARTPLYPLLFLAVGFSVRGVTLVQMALGVGVTALLFLMALRLSGNPATASFGALLYALNLPQLMFESAVLTETLTTFLLVSSALLVVGIMGPERRRSSLMLGGLGLCVGLTALARPLFAFLPILFLIPVLLCGRPWHRVALYVLLAFAPVLMWSTFNYARLGYFGPTTLAGYNLTNHTGAFIEDAPKEFARIRDIYLPLRAANGGDQLMVIWRAVGPMMQATGQSFPELSQTVMSMDVSLIAGHPLQYGKSVFASAKGFWKGQGRGYSSSEWVSSSPLPALGSTWLLWKYITVALNGFFLIAVCGGVLLVCIKRRLSPIVVAAAWIASIVLATCLVQALMECGESARYGMPVQPLAWLVVCLGAWAVLRWVSDSRGSRRRRGVD